MLCSPHRDNTIHWTTIHWTLRRIGLKDHLVTNGNVSCDVITRLLRVRLALRAPLKLLDRRVTQEQPLDPLATKINARFSLVTLTRNRDYRAHSKSWVEYSVTGH